ncbi:lysophospholipid acyltransferase family protein [Salinifilum aidingensis]
MRKEDQQHLPEGARLALHRGGRRFARMLGSAYRLRVHRADRVPRSGPVVLVANHSALVDGPLLFGVLPRDVVFLIKAEMFRGPVGWFLRRIGQLAVRRGEPDRTPLLAAVRVLRHGGTVAVFPEGTRGTGEVDNAQNGAAWLARTAQAPVLPVACRGTARPGRWPRLRPRVDVLFGEPVELPSEKGRVGLRAATDRVRSELVDLVVALDELVADQNNDQRRGKQA